jgi:hypothetical protein
MKRQSFVMPAWMAGIQAPQDASGDIHVGLDSSTPCWNDGIEGFYWNSPSPLLPVFSKEDLARQSHN